MLTQNTIETPAVVLPLRRKKDIWKACLLAIVFPLVLYIIYRSPVGQWFHPAYMENLKKTLPGWYLWGPFFFWLAGSLSIALGMPRTMISFCAGSIFGFWYGIALIELTCLTGAIIAFTYTRWIRRTFLVGIFQREVPFLDNCMKTHGFLTMLLLRQMPMPGAIVNVLAGISCIKTGIFLMASAIGFLPQNIIFVLYGSGLQRNFFLNASLASFFLIALTALCYYLFQRMELAHKLWYHLPFSRR